MPESTTIYEKCTHPFTKNMGFEFCGEAPRQSCLRLGRFEEIADGLWLERWPSVLEMRVFGLVNRPEIPPLLKAVPATVSPAAAAATTPACTSPIPLFPIPAAAKVEAPAANAAWPLTVAASV